MCKFSSPKFFFIFSIIIIANVFSAHAQTPQAVVSIETNTNATSGPDLEVPIYLDLMVPSLEFQRVDFTIKYNSDALTPKGLNWYGWVGSYVPECEWNSVWFNIYPDPDCGGIPCSTSLLHVYAFKNANPGTCYLDSSLRLGSIFFETHGDSGQFYPLSFYWDSCFDNSFSQNFELDTLLVSNKVFDYNDEEITENLPLPSFTGAPDDCLPGSGDTLRTRAIDFHSGGVQFIGIDTSMPSRNTIAIEKTHETLLHDSEQVSIFLNDNLPTGGHYQTFGSFEFLIQYDTNVATFLSASAGQLMIDCGWEYMSWGHGPGLDCGGSPCPDGIIYLNGIADIDNGDFHPTCLADSIGELVVMEFYMSGYYDEYECYYSPINFIWYDCSNNTIAYDENSDTIFISNEIYDYNNPTISIRQNIPFPTRYGAPYECLGEVIPGTTNVRAVDFYNGGFQIVCIDTIDMRGDINLNGISNEIADFVLLSNYFFYGISVFTINMQNQIAASDVNADGLNLTLNDLIYMYRIIIGDALPYAKISPRVVDTCFIKQDYDTKTISMVYTDSIIAIYLKFGDSIEPSLYFPHHQGGAVYANPITNILLAPYFDSYQYFPDSFLISEGELFTYTGEGHLLSGVVSYRGLTDIPVVIQRVGSSNCCYNRGNVNGINGPGGPINVADLTYLVSYLFKGGSVPICVEEGNADGITIGDLQINVADLTYLVNYLFKGGSNPPACP